MVVRGRFALAPGVLAPAPDQGRLSGDLFEDDDPDATGASTKPSDLADFKLRGEVLLTGACHAPGGKATGESFVRLSVKGAKKPLVTIDRRVFGARVWTESLVGKAMTDPIPFTTMPLGWSHALGGEGFAANPVGKGIGTHELPNVEWPQVITSKGDRPSPACPGPISPYWPARTSKVGKQYGKDWEKERRPYYAADFDWSFFQSAPPEQQIDGYFRGDEALELVNLHPSVPNIEATLPGLRVRVFLRDVHGRFREVTLALDTIHVDSAEGFIDLSWRGVDAVAEQDLSDLAFVIIASEPLESPAKASQHYEQMMEDFVADPLGMRDAIPAELRPVYERAMKLAEAEKAGSSAPEKTATDPLEAELERAASLLEPAEAEKVRTAVRTMRAAAEKMHKEAVEAAREANKPPPPPLDETIAKAVAAAKLEPAKPAVDFQPDGKPRIDLSGLVKAQKDMLDAMRAQSDLPPEARAKLDEAERSIDDPRLGELDPGLRGAAPLPEPGPGRDLRRRNFRGMNLAGADLSGSDLSGAILSGVNLEGANLSGCTFAHALADRANLKQVNLRGAKLDSGVFLEADLSGADLTEATLDQAVLARAKLDGAKLDRAKGSLVLASKASFRGVQARELSLLQSDLSECDLEGADFTRASLVRCLVRDAKGARACFTGAKIGHVCFEGADLTEARFDRATGPFPSFMQATLERTDLAFTVLPGAHFEKARGKGARFYAANLPEARFSRAKLESASFERANLMSADFNLATVPKCSFRGASLYDAKLIGTAGEGCDFRDANLTRSTLEGVS